MKSILYVGATLMIGASIYGFVDYKSSSQKKEFTTMYETVEETLPVITEEKKVNEVKPTKEPAKKTEARKTRKKEEESLPVTSKSGDFVIPVEPIKVESGEVAKTDELEESKSVKKIKSARSKKINSKLFSRGSLEERYVEKTLKPVSKSKNETKKAEVKEEL